MPRVENQGQNVSEWCEKHGEVSSTYDVCRGCANRLKLYPNQFNKKLTPYNGDPQGENGWVDDGCFHPEYDGEDYKCAVCGKKLTEKDD